MNLLILTTCHFLHLIATVVWIGGILMILLVLLPGAKASMESGSMISGLMKEISNRFTPMANISIIVLIITGIVSAFYDKNFTNILDFRNHWNQVMILKHLFVASMIIIHFYRGLILNPKIARLSAEPDESGIAKLKQYSLNLVWINLFLGLIVLFLSAIISTI
jgi:uncharacterized membrane protein